MTEIGLQSYLDNDHHTLPGQQLVKEFIVQIDDSFDCSFSTNIKVFGWSKIFEFKKQIISLKHFDGISSSSLRLFHKNIEMADQDKTLLDYKIFNGSIILIDRRNKIQQSGKGVINPYKLFNCSNEKVNELIKSSIEAINSDIIPTLTSEGTSGVYMIENSNGKKISIFKPFDEEVNAPNNPRGKVGKLGSDGISKGILSGQCATREVAAYLLNSEAKNYHSVPVTTYIQFYHPTFVHKQFVEEMPIASSQELKIDFDESKHGSLQEFVTSQGIIGNYGSSRFSDSQIHKIAILDIRILNCDRNQENILVQKDEKGNLQLVPIDHGLSLPDNLQIYEGSLLWMGFPQSKKPFSEDQLKFIDQINPAKDAEMMSSKLGFRPICLRNFRISEIFLKKSAGLGFTLFEIGKMMYRTQDEQEDEYLQQKLRVKKNKRSILQNIVMQSQNLYLNSLQTIQKQNLSPKQNELQDQQTEQFQVLEEISEQSQESKRNSDTNSTAISSESKTMSDSVKNLLALKRKVSLPQLTRKTTSFHELRNKERKLRQGVNGVSKSVWNKYHKQEWNELFYYYFENILDTFLNEKCKQKKRKLSHKSSSAK